MSSEKYTGMNADTLTAVADQAHITQSINTILLTPIGSRVMRRDFGSQLYDLIDQPNGGAVRLQMMAAIYTALAKWEPRVTLSSIAFTSTTGAQLTATLSGTRADSGTGFNADILLRST